VWQLFLLVGPGIERLRYALSRVRSITTDMGAEHHIVNLPDFTIEFFNCLRVQLPPIFQPLPFLFPRALLIHGWNHLIDNCLDRSLGWLKWFPKFLESFRALLSFLRRDNWKDAFTKSLRARGFVGIASLLSSLSFPNFAEWRWHTLNNACKEVKKCLDSLRMVFNPSEFSKERDKTRYKLFCHALTSPDWLLQFGFVSWMAEWLGTIQAWGGGCPCHDRDDPAAASCDQKGRRLHQAFEYASVALKRGLDQANAWTPARWNDNVEMWRCVQASTRDAYVLAMEKIGHLDAIPYLLARIGQPGIAARCVAQFEARDVAAHHRVSVEFLGVGSPLRYDVEQVLHDGSGMSAALLREVDSLRGIPLDDSVAEGPHAVAKRIGLHARRALWPWVASSMRLEQNLADHDDLVGAVDADVQSLWTSYSSVVRPVASNKPVRMTRKSLEARVYRLSAFVDRGAEPEDNDDGDGDDDGDDGDGSGSDKADKAEAIALEPAPPPLVKPARPSAEARLLREYLLVALEVGSYITIVGQDGIGMQPCAQTLLSCFVLLYCFVLKNVGLAAQANGGYETTKHL
jgi:hypothetical protein